MHVTPANPPPPPSPVTKNVITPLTACHADLYYDTAVLTDVLLLYPTQVRKYLAEAFPQTSFADDIDDEEVSRFAESEGGRFPDPQYCPGLHWLVKDKGGSDTREVGGSSGVALVGDAIHAFPPDLGQVRRGSVGG